MAKVYRKKKKRQGVYILFTLVILLILVVLAVAAFFNVSEIEVQGNSIYQTQELIDASGIQQGQNMMLLKTDEIESNLKNQFNYIIEVHIYRSLPDKVCLEIVEETPVAWLQQGDTVWMLDKNCRLVETGMKADTQGLIEIRGITVSDPVRGQIAENEEDNSKVRYLASILTGAVKNSLAEEIRWVDVSNAGNLLVQYGKQYLVELGAGVSIENKMSLLKEILPELKGGGKGTVVFIGENEAHFIPD